MYSTTARSFLGGSTLSDRSAGGRGPGGVADQVDGQDVGQRLGGERTPGGVSHQLVIHRQHRGAEL